MINVFIEATNGPQNWGKFMVARFDEEWKRTSAVLWSASLSGSEGNRSRVGIKKLPPLPPMLSGLGWAGTEIIVFDLQTCEGAAFSPGGLASSDLNKHRIWVCPLFEPFLQWLYQQDLTDLSKLPKHIDLPGAEFAMYGYRRKGK